MRHKHSTMIEFIFEGSVTIDFVRSGDNLADSLTKALAREKAWSTSKGRDLNPLINKLHVMVTQLGDWRS